MEVGRNPPKKANVSTFFEKLPTSTADWCDVAGVTIDILPDIALLEIFDFYLDTAWIEDWHTLVHVCQRWRIVVFGSPRRLNLRLCCTITSPVKELLDVWPLLPVIVVVHSFETWCGTYGEENIIAALEHNDRICEICCPSLPLAVLAVMQQPFPELTRLQLGFGTEASPDLPTSFLGGSAPRLQTLTLDCIAFRGLPKLLLSATHLVKLEIVRIPYSGYISPESMVSGVSALTRLERLAIGFNSPLYLPDRKGRHPQTCTLPVLTELWLMGVCEYLEDLVARIDAPLLDNLAITIFYQPILDTPQLTQFISRTPKFKSHNEARVVFSDEDVRVGLPQSFDGALQLAILCERRDWQLSSLVQVCSSSFPRAFIAAVEHLYILKDAVWDWGEDTEISQWLGLFHTFALMKDLYISQEFVPRIALALQELVGERVTEALPALQSLFLEEPLPSGPVQENIEKFVAARQLAGHPITVSCWKRTSY